MDSGRRHARESASLGERFREGVFSLVRIEDGLPRHSGETTGGFPSGQRGQTVNLMDLSFEGSNPSPPISLHAVRAGLRRLLGVEGVAGHCGAAARDFWACGICRRAEC